MSKVKYILGGMLAGVIALGQTPDKPWPTYATGSTGIFITRSLDQPSLMIFRKDGKEALRITPKGEVIIGEGFTPSEAAHEFVEALRKAYSNFPECAVSPTPLPPVETLAKPK